MQVLLPVAAPQSFGIGRGTKGPTLAKTARMGHPRLITPRGIIEVVSSHGRLSEKNKEGEEMWATRPPTFQLFLDELLQT